MIDRLPFLARYRKPFVSVLRLQGMIAASMSPGRLCDANLAPVIEAAFRYGKPVAVALVINSPGGSPAQSSLIAARIRRLAGETKTPVIAFVEDLAASGGYWLATAADEIFIDSNSIIGSIGVISAGFGLDQFIASYGIERRVYTSGKSKSMLDPFRPENPEDVLRLRALQDKVHEGFIAQVKARRGARLADGDLYSGEIWVGQDAVDLGLVDGIGHLAPVLKARFGDRLRFRDYGMRRPFLSRLGLRLIEDTVTLAQERSLYAQYGL